MKKYLTAFLSGLAVMLGLGVFIVYKIVKHNENKHYAELFLKANKDNVKQKILDDLQLQEIEFEKQVKELTAIHEQNDKEEIINAFKSAFGVPVTKP